MALTTCTVRCALSDQNGQPLAGAVITATLNRYEVYQGHVVPRATTAVTAADGTAQLALWPNALGAVESAYEIAIQPSGGTVYRTTAVVPNLASTDLHLISELPPYPGMTNGQLLIDTAADTVTVVLAAKDTAVASANDAGMSATNAAASASSASTSASSAATSAVAAATSESNAAASASNAATSESNAATSATAAANSATAAATSATNASDTVASLAAAGGSTLVGHGSETVKAALDARLPEIGTYALLRAYTGPLTAFYVRGVASLFDGGAGAFRVDTADTTSADNGGTILVDAIGRRWKRERPAGWLGWSPKVFGAVGDGVEDDTDAVKRGVNDEGRRVIIDAVFKVTDSVPLTSGIKMFGSRNPAACGFTGALGTKPIFICDGPINAGEITNVGFENVTSGGCIVLANGAHMWRLDRLLFRNCVGPAIVYDSVWDSEFYNIHVIGGGSVSGLPIDNAAIVSKGDSNNNTIFGLRIEQPKNCGIYVGANTDLRVVNGKIDCGFVTSPVNAGSCVEGTLRLNDFLFAGFTTPKLDIRGVGKVFLSDTTLGGGGGAPHVKWTPGVQRSGSTAASIKPISGAIRITGGIIGGVHPSVTTKTPYAFDVTLQTQVRREATISAVASGTSVFLSGHGYTANDTDSKFFLSSKADPRGKRAKINTSFVSGQLDLCESHGMTAGTAVFVEWEPNDFPDLEIDQSVQITDGLKLFNSITATVTSSAYSDGRTTVVTNYSSATHGSAAGRMALLASGEGFRIVDEVAGELKILGDVTTKFTAGLGITVESGGVLDATNVGGYAFWYLGATQKTASLRTLRSRQRDLQSVFPWKD